MLDLTVMNKTIIQFVTICFIIPISICWGQQTIPVDRKAWLEDLEFLEHSVSKIFPDFESHQGSGLFLQELSDLRKDVPTLSPKEIVFRIQKAMGALGDEGCSILPFQEVLETTILPISLYSFEDGWYICDAKDKALVGQRVLGMDGRSMGEVYDMMKPYLNADNIHYQERLFAVYGIVPNMLRSSGLEGADTAVRLQLSGDREILLEAGPLSEYTSLDRKLPNDGHFQLNQRNHENENYWLEYIPNSETMYVQLQQISNNEEGPSFKKFVDLVADGISTGKAKKIILDVRYGGGGNGFKLKPLTDLLRDSEQINQDGNLVVLTSKATKGTLLELVSLLTLNTQAVVIGEPTGEGPNTVGDVRVVQMPNSKIKVSLTSIFWPTSWEIDKRSTLEPHVEVTFTIGDYLNGEDPWLNAATAYVGSRQLAVMDTAIAEQLSGTYDVHDRKVKLSWEDNQFTMQMGRRIKSFFEFKAKLFPKSEGVLASTIEGVDLHYKRLDSGQVALLYLDWKGTKMDMNRK